MKFELNPDKLYLLGILSRVRKHEAGHRDIVDLARYFAYLSLVVIEGESMEFGEEVDDFVFDCFRAIYKDSVFNFPIDCTDRVCVSETRLNLLQNKYLVAGDRGNPLRLTEKGFRFLHECLDLMANDASSRKRRKLAIEDLGDGKRKRRSRAGRTHTNRVFRVAAMLYTMLSSLGLNPVIIPSFPLIGGIQYRKNEKTQKSQRFLIPDIIIKLDAQIIPPELGLSRYISVELQSSHFDELGKKQIKYDNLMAENAEDLISSSLYPLYVLRNSSIKSDSDREKFLNRVKTSILKQISDAPEWVGLNGKEPSPLLDCPNSFLPFFNVGILDDRSVNFLKWPNGPLPPITEETLKRMENVPVHDLESATEDDSVEQ
jgi:hypothetical protein